MEQNITQQNIYERFKTIIMPSRVIRDWAFLFKALVSALDIDAGASMPDPLANPYRPLSCTCNAYQGDMFCLLLSHEYEICVWELYVKGINLWIAKEAENFNLKLVHN